MTPSCSFIPADGSTSTSGTAGISVSDKREIIAPSSGLPPVVVVAGDDDDDDEEEDEGDGVV